MVLFPKIGRRYWIVTDFYEVFHAIPVILMRRGGLFNYINGTRGLYILEFWLLQPGTKHHENGWAEEYDRSRRGLFHTEHQARRVARRLNKEAKQRE